MEHRSSIRADPIGRADGRPSFALMWWLLFPLAQLVAFVIIVSVHPAGLDECEAAASAATRALQATVATLAVVGPAAFAVWRLRRLQLLAALIPVAACGSVWVLLLIGSQSCTP